MAPKCGQSSARGAASPRGEGRPVSSSCVAVTWLTSEWCTERITARRCALAASAGKCSEIIRPGTLVAIGRNSPRTCSGASGLRSHVSCCAGPPHMKSRMHAFARPKVVPRPGPVAASARARSKFGRPRPCRPKPSPPAQDLATGQCMYAPRGVASGLGPHLDSPRISRWAGPYWFALPGSQSPTEKHYNPATGSQEQRRTRHPRVESEVWQSYSLIAFVIGTGRGGSTGRDAQNSCFPTPEVELGEAVRRDLLKY